MCFGTVGPVNSGFGRGRGVLGYVLGEDGGGTAVDIRASSTASTVTRYGVEETWGLGGVLTVVGEVVGARLDEFIKGERGAVSAMEAGARPVR